MVGHRLDATRIHRVEVRTFRESAALFPGMPETTSDVQYSLAFALTAMLRHGKVGPHQISDAGLCDPSVEHLIPRITVTENAGYSRAFPARCLADVGVTPKHGTRYLSGEIEARGGPEAPLPQEEMQAKSHAFAEAAPVNTLAGALWRLRKRPMEPGVPFADVIALLTPAAISRTGAVAG